MQTICLRFFLGAMIIITGCEDMHQQVSVQAQEAPHLSSPALAVPVSGTERLEFGREQTNPHADSAATRQRGALLYIINCSPSASVACPPLKNG